MITDEIKFIQTDKEGVELQVIQENYPNSIIYAKKENNVYIGSDRITDHIVVDKILNLTDGTLKEVYLGMLVFVVEDKSLYILSTNSGEREWKKVGSDIDIEELKKSSKKLSSNITVAGLSSSIGNVSNGKVYTTEHTIEDIIRDLLCLEIYPSVSLTRVNPKITFGGLKDATASNHSSFMEVGSDLELNPVTLGVATISDGYRVGSGFTNGYSTTNDNKKDGDANPPRIDAVNVSLDGSYSLTETYTPSSIGTIRTVDSSEDFSKVKFNSGSVKIALGSNTISFTAKSPSGVYTHPKYPEYFVVSNLGNTSPNEKLEESVAVSNATVARATSTASITVTGVYPVYVNIVSNSLVEEPVKMNLTSENVFVIDAPKETQLIQFKFDYPATHSVKSFLSKDLSGNFVSVDSAYDDGSESKLEKEICGQKVLYKRLQITGSPQGDKTYKITLSKGLDE